MADNWKRAGERDIKSHKIYLFFHPFLRLFWPDFYLIFSLDFLSFFLPFLPPEKLLYFAIITPSFLGSFPPVFLLFLISFFRLDLRLIFHLFLRAKFVYFLWLFWLLFEVLFFAVFEGFFEAVFSPAFVALLHGIFLLFFLPTLDSLGAVGYNIYINIKEENYDHKRTSEADPFRLSRAYRLHGLYGRLQYEMPLLSQRLTCALRR